MENSAAPRPVDDTRTGRTEGPGSAGCSENASRAAPCGAALEQRLSGGVLLSHSLSVAVPSALNGLTSGFGMGPGVSRFAMAAVTLSTTSNLAGLLVGNCLVDANTVCEQCVRWFARVCAWCHVLLHVCATRVCGLVRGWDKPSAY